MKQYPINEIFNSIQGEGVAVGTPVLFVRLAGCNRKCWFCDTEHQEPKIGTFTQEELIELIEESANGKHILFTGGEPMMYLEGELLAKLVSLGYKLHLETNGDYDIPVGFQELIDYISIAPKSVNTLMKVVQKEFKKPISLKLLVPMFHQKHLEDAINKMTDSFIVYIMSVNGNLKIDDENNQYAISAVDYFAERYTQTDIRYGVQVHKLLGVR